MCIAEEEHDISTPFLQTQKNQYFDLQDHLERYCNDLLVCDFNSATCDKTLMKSYLQALLVNEREIKPIEIMKTNQFVSFKFGDVQLLDILNCLGGTASFVSFSKTYETLETKGIFHMDGSMVQ